MHKRHMRYRLEEWCKKLCQTTSNRLWKSSRNLYAILLVDQLLQKKIQSPFAHLPPDDEIPFLKGSDVVIY